jgi:hypothetical protein
MFFDIFYLKFSVKQPDFLAQRGIANNNDAMQAAKNGCSQFIGLGQAPPVVSTTMESKKFA